MIKQGDFQFTILFKLRIPENEWNTQSTPYELA